MKLIAFRIRNFRSILDTGWRDLSTDNITGLIGQNESGKSSVLEALHSFDNGVLDEDYLRSDGSYPEVCCSFELTESELIDIFENFELHEDLIGVIKKNKNRVNFVRRWSGVTEKDSVFSLEQSNLIDYWQEEEDTGQVGDAAVNEDAPEPGDGEPGTTPEATPEPEVESKSQPTADEFLSGLSDEMPVFELFADYGSLLPAKIDLSDVVKNNQKTKGIKGAQNFLTIIGIKPEDISGDNERIIERRIRDANKKLTKEFQEFWSQYIGKNNKIEIEFDLKRHSDTDPATAGQPYLVFWVKDGEEVLHPAQRSKGVQWFLSFFLQLKASAMLSEKGQVLLIDEPGASLHGKAQEDVLKVFEDIKKSLQIIYTTHSPYLIEADTLYRLLAVQRSNEDDDNSETKVYGVHELGTASQDTLLPIYTLIGVNLQHQRVIKAKNNIILEEPSAFYYLKAFKHLLGEAHEMNFIPSTGVTKIPLLVNLFLGWGLQFIVLTDDDDAGKRIRRKLKSEVYGGNDDLAKANLLPIDGCEGVEDIFTKGDFKTHVLGDKTLTYTESNSAYMGSNKESKVLMAVKFCLAVENGDFKKDDFAKTTISAVEKLFKQIKDRL
ncbi:MAG: AAA family ATPase [Candidatus Saccharimonadales bacterium]